MSYLETAHAFYQEAARMPQPALCCAARPKIRQPGLHVPESMLAMDYGCGSAVDPRDVAVGSKVVYVGVGGGLEALLFAYFTRAPGAVVAIDRVPEMLDVARRNLAEATATNEWFRPEFVELRRGDALDLPVASGVGDLVAQNCLFNVFERADLRRALVEARRVLVPGGRLTLSDPVAPRPIPERLAGDERLRAMCLSGALPWDEYVAEIVAAGFGTVEVRARRPFRVLDRARYGLDEDLVLDSVDASAVNEPVPSDGACVFTGRAAFYVGEEDSFDDGAGHVLPRDVPLQVCDKTAARLAALGNREIVVTGPTWHYDGGGCC
jgi:SAM-dependent methyltransferase